MKMELSGATALADAVESLKQEVKQLKEALAAATSEPSSLRPPDTYASKAAARRPAQQARHRALAANKRGANRGGNKVTPGSNTLLIPTRTSSTAKRVVVPGVRRVWGTVKYTSPTALISTITKLTKLDIGNKLSVKRRFKEGDSTHRDRWWFLLKADEAVLCELQNLWETVQLQTNWKLETCTKPDSEGIVTTDGPSQESNLTEAGSHGASADTLTITVSQQSRSDHGSTTDPDDNLADHDQDLSPPSIPPTQQ